MSAEENKAVVVRMHEAVNRHDLTALDEHPGMAGTREFLTRYFQVCPDAQATIEELVAEGEWVVVRMISHGTQQGEWGGVAPSGQRQEDEVLAMHRIVDGHIVTSYSQGGPLQGVA